MSNEQQQTTQLVIQHTEDKLFLTTKEVMERYRLSSPTTLWNWRRKIGFPAPIHNGRFYSRKQLEAWDREQEAA
ncbi:helix-turn-helix transcriptional regulator [Shewanella algae]|uniref:helix-turn-helix transcriptional regulator n=1 Tax=Shewanella algae TaxID=38313 RepID=UPI001AADE4C1|nr:helix-turn-helix domain-containing protein [Shewanella algae]MBO2658100.1 helix-turn-helix domain-containing protein [Shewanella algae]